jgi:hypothetical protein
MADPLSNELRNVESSATWSSNASSVRQFVADYNAGRYNFKLPFQRKPQWKQGEKSEWIRALLKGTRLDPLSISIRMGNKRGINGGNRAGATVHYTRNEFPIDIPFGRDVYHYWFSEVPAEYSNGRSARFHRVLTDEQREERFLDREIYFNVGRGLSDQEEVDWYTSMNQNQKSHTKGQLLLSNLCKDANDPFVMSMLNLFPVMKTRIQLPITESDEHALGSVLADIFNVEPDPMDERDTREDFALLFATYTNLLANGRPYNGEFVGECDPAVVQQNVDTLMCIFDGLTISDGMFGEFHSPSSSKKQFVPRIWSPSYLLGPICWSIGKQKEGVVHVWRSFLERCVPNTIATTYSDENDSAHLDDTSVRKYETAWNNVLAQHI